MRSAADASGWERGWQEFFEAYHPLLFRFARRQGLSEGEADDLVQEVVIGVARRLPEFQYEPGRCSFRTWLFRVARNKVVDHHRRQMRERRHLVRDDQLPSMPDAEDPATLAPDASWDLEFESNLRRVALERVSQRVRPMTLRLYLHHVVDGHDVASTVAQFRDARVSAASVYVAKHRVQALLNRELNRLRAGRCDP